MTSPARSARGVIDGACVPFRQNLSFLACFTTSVRAERAGLIESPPASITCIWFLTAVYAQVLSEMPTLCESPGTFGAGVRSLSGVSPPMFRQIAAIRERFVAISRFASFNENKPMLHHLLPPIISSSAISHKSLRIVVLPNASTSA